MKTVALYGEYLNAFLPMDPFGLSVVLSLKGSFALGTTIEREDGTDRPAGLVIVSEDSDRLIIDWIYVRPEYREQGIGSNLMIKVFEEALSRGMESVSARISDEFDEVGMQWNTDSFFVNDVFSIYDDDILSEIRLKVNDLSKILRADEDKNEAAAEDKSIIPLKKVPKKDRQAMIKAIEKDFSAQLFAEAEDIWDAADDRMSFIMFQSNTVAGALFSRKVDNTWYVYSLMAKDDDGLEKLARVALYYSEDYAKISDHICIQPQKEASVRILDKLGIPYRSYDIHFITAKISDYKKHKNVVNIEDI